MKNVLVPGMIMAAMLFAGLSPAQEYKGPKIVVKEIQHDLGKVVQGTEASHVFEVSNAGSEQLVIDRVVPS